ncbi:MAG TPA: PadR family transcriptional regulator, partial [Candidatus Acidoferrales bacterium]|nr:PadR family transcriptional regulator [Candidatus Acidoferrales bacterium]
MSRTRTSRSRIVTKAKDRGARGGAASAQSPVQPQSDEVPVRTRPPTGPPKATLEHALLGLIAEAPGPVSGYDLMKLFDLSMSHYWHAYQGQIYPTLERMADFGIIKGRSVSKGWRPKVRLYTITQSGLRLLVEWLESTFEEVRLKHPPLLRCRFLGHLGPDGALRILQEER